MSMQVKGYAYADDPRVVNKRMTSQPIVLECRITDPSDVVNPVLFLTVADGIENCNYFTLGQRKYFKTGQTRMSNNMIKIRLHEDILSTWMPFVHVHGKILNATQNPHLEIDQGYLRDVDTKISRVRISNAYEEVTNYPAIIIQSPLPAEDKPST